MIDSRRNGVNGTNGHARAEMPPQDRDAESALLGTMLRDSALIDPIAALVRADHFYVVAHQHIFRAILSLDCEGVAVDIVTVGRAISEAGLSDEIGGLGYLWLLHEAALPSANYREWAESVRATAALNSVRHVAAELARRADDIMADPADLIEFATDRLEQITRPAPTVERFSLSELIQQYPIMHSSVIEGFLRQREIANVVSSSKIGKSWLAYGLVLSVATGRPWFDRFATEKRRVLLIDNELHKPTLARRILTVAEAMGIPLGEYQDVVEVWPLRGNLRDIYQIGRDLRRAKGFGLIVFDAKYRMTPAGSNENANADETRLYNALDTYAEATGAAILNVGHSSKGSQADKRVTDVGAGAGAQSRAADSHIVLREHEDDGVVVLDGAVRSFPPPEPLPLRWVFPLWTPDTGLDPSKLRGRLSAQEQRQRDRDAEGIAKIIAQLMLGPKTARQLRKAADLSKDRVDKLVHLLRTDGRIEAREIDAHGNRTEEYSVKK